MTLSVSLTPGRPRPAGPRTALPAAVLGGTPLVSRCAGCGAPGPAVCAACCDAVGSLVPAEPGIAVAAVSHTGVARDLVHGLKYRNRRRAARLLADLLASRLGDVAAEIDVVTWAPTSDRRRADRGYDQAELVARALARRVHRPCRRLLYRVHGRPQSGRSRAERLAGPVFVARPSRRPRRVLVVDDVVTTGATLRAAARALHVAGADHVVLAAVSAAPRRT